MEFLDIEEGIVENYTKLCLSVLKADFEDSYWKHMVYLTLLSDVGKIGQDLRQSVVDLVSKEININEALR